jgi:hypothetical protein
VTGRRIDELERGQGLSPFDPEKIVFTGYGPGSQDPYGELPATATAAAPDRTAPRLRMLARRGRILRFSLDEPATVRVSVLRGARVVQRRTLRGRRGVNTVRLRRGRYRVALLAVDAAGNAARARTVVVR